jgi:ABC-type Mn2+/Zn2+ transport system permease subunit
MWGDVLALSWHDILDLGLVLLGVALCHALLYKEFLFCSFDPAMAATLHFRVWAFDLIFFASLGVLISFSLQVVGLLVVFAYLVVPGVIGLLAARTLRGAFLVGIGAALLASVLGLHLSWVLDLPAGLTLVAVLVALTPVAALVDRVRRGRPIRRSDPSAFQETIPFHHQPSEEKGEPKRP